MSIPHDLQAIPQWVELHADRNGALKLPADVTDKNTWGTYAPKKGFVLAGYIGIDFDKVFTDERLAWMLPYIEKLKAVTYVEKSMSGTGCKAIGKGTFTAKAKMKGGKGIEFDIAEHTGIAFYTPWWNDEGKLMDGRQFAMTGDALEGTAEKLGDITAIATELYEKVVEWHAKVKGKKPATAPLVPIVTPELDMADKIISRATRARNGKKFLALMEGNTADYASASEADIALANMVAFYTKDRELVKEVMLRSKLDRQKWQDRPDYLMGTIENACGFVTETATVTKIQQASGDCLVEITILPSTYKVYPTGVQQVDTRITKDGEVREDIKDIAKWRTFTAERICDDHGIITYDVTIDGTAYSGTIDDIVKITKTGHGCTAHFMHVMGAIYKALIEKLDPPRCKIFPFVGFDDGWKVGFNGEAFNITDTQREFLDIEISKAVLDKNAAILAFKGLYDASTIDHKDIITAWGLVAPFMNDIAKSTDLAVILSLGGQPATAKSKKLEELTMKWWGWPSYRINCANIGTPSRFDDLLTYGSTPTLVDEVDKFPEVHVGKLKQITTGRGKNIKKGKGAGGQGITARGIYCSTPCFTYNYQNPLYDDSALLERVLDIQIKTKNTIEGGKKYMAVYDATPNALIGRYIIEATKDFTHKTIMDLYNNAPDYPVKEGEKADDRINKVFKTIYVGAVLVKRLFDITLSLDRLPALVKGTRDTGSDEAVSMIYEYVAEQAKDKKNRASWVQSEMFIADDFNKKLAYFSAGSAKDISTRLGKKIPLAQLAGIIDRAYASSKYYNTRANGVPGWYCVVNLDKGFKVKTLTEQQPKDDTDTL